MEIPESLKPNPEVQPQAASEQPVQAAVPAKVNLLNPSGDLVSLPSEMAHEALNQGYEQASPQDVEQHFNEEKYGTPSEMAKTFLEGAGVGGTFGLSTAIERAFGANPEDILKRAQTNPLIHGLGQGVGFGASAALPGLGEANVAKGLGEVGVGALGAGAEATGFAAQAARKALPLAADFLTMQTGDEISKMIVNDPEQSVGTAAANIGLSGLMGLGGGVGLAALSPLAKATGVGKLGQFIEDFKGRIHEHLENPNPAQTVHGELENYYKNITDLADTVYGAKGIKSQGVEKFLPEMSEKITGQVQGLRDNLNKAVLNLKDDPFVPRLQRAVDTWEKAVTENGTPSGIFDATQDLKQQLQEWGKFNKNLVPLAEKDFRETAKSLSYDLRTALESPDVWGDAAKVQQKINKAFTEYLPTLKDFEKKFTSEINGEKVVDAGKVSTYVNQLGKSNAELKQSMLDNFLKASEKYKDVINQTHSDLGLSSPYQETGLNFTKRTLNEISPGAKAADILVKKGLAGPAGMVLGAGVGGALGHTVGAGGFGAIIGEHALGPFFSSLLPALTKPILLGMNSGEGLNAAVNYGMDVIKGDQLVKKAVKGIFTGGAKGLTEFSVSDKDRQKLIKKLDQVSNNPEEMFNVGQNTAHYLPSHGTAISQTAMNAVNYLNSQRPQQVKQSPLDPKLPLTFAQKAQWDRTLNIAQQPLIVMNHLKAGTLLPSDIKTLQTLYPALYTKITNDIQGHLVDMTSKEENIPYKTRQSLSLFLGQPLDSTMTPQSIMSVQSIYAAKTQAMNNPAQSGKPRRNTGKMDKISDQFKTSFQASQERRMSE